MGFLYRLDFTSDKSYIGVTIGKALSRFYGHSRSVKKGSQYLVHKAWRKYGPPKLQVLAVVEDYDLLATEQRAVAVFNTMSPHGYNMTPGGDTSPTSVPEIAAKVSVAMMGHDVSEETREKLSIAFKGKPLDEVRAKAFGKYWLGRKHSTKSKKKMSKAQKGRTFSKESREKMSISRTGKVQSVETCEKRSKSMKGKPSHMLGKKHSKKTRKKMSDSHKARAVANKRMTSD